MNTPAADNQTGPPQFTGFRRILKNSATLISARVISKFAMTLFMVVVARSMGAEDFGVYSSVLAFIAFFSLVEEFGLTPPMIRRLAKRREEGAVILGRVVGLKAILGVAAYVLLMVTSVTLDVSPEITAILGLSMIFEFLSLTVTRAFEAYEKMRYIAVITIIERSVLCLAGIGVVLSGGNLVELSLAYLGTFIISLIVSTRLFSRKILPFRPLMPGTEWRPLLREATPFMVASILSVVWTRADIYFLTTYRSPSEVGWYNAALRIIEAQIFIPVALLSSVFPVLTRMYGVSVAEFRRMLGKNLLFILLAGISVAAATYFLSGKITDILFGPEYVRSVEILRIFSPMIVCSFMNYLLGGALIAMGRETYNMVMLGIGAAVCVVGGFLFIPSGGGPAAGFIKLVAEALVFLAQGLILLIFLWRGRHATGTESGGPGAGPPEPHYDLVPSRTVDE